MGRLKLLYLLLIICSVAYYYLFDVSGVSYCITNIGLVAFALILYFVFQQKSIFKGWWIKPSNLLLVGLLIVNLQYVLDLVIGYKSYSFFKSEMIVNKCCGLGSIGILSFLYGNVTRVEQSTDRAVNNKKIGLSLLCILLLVFFIGWVASVDIVSLVTGLSYGTNDGWGGGLAANMEELLYDTILVILITQITNNRLQENGSSFFKSFPFLFWIVVLGYLLIRLLSGDRGPFIYTSLALFFTYIFMTKKKISLKYVTVFFVCFAFLITLVGIARSMASDYSLQDRVSMAFSSAGQARFGDKTVLVPTEELAMSFRCNETAIGEIERGMPFHYGKYQFYHVLNYIPFMPSFLYNHLKIPITELSSDYYLTEALLGDYSRTQIGTTAFADFFLDFGAIGIVLGFFIMGLCFRWVDYNVCINSSNTFFTAALSILFASQTVYIPRSTFLSAIRPIVIIAVIYYVNKKISIKK